MIFRPGMVKFKNRCVRLIQGCPKNGVLTVHYGVEEINVNVREMLKTFYYLPIWRSLKVALIGELFRNICIILS
jgi:hypothetical protein